jgi:hypothetical protein
MPDWPEYAQLVQWLDEILDYAADLADAANSLQEACMKKNIEGFNLAVANAMYALSMLDDFEGR